MSSSGLQLPMPDSEVRCGRPPPSQKTAALRAVRAGHAVAMATGDLVQVEKRELSIPVGDGAGRGYGDSITVTNVAAEDIAFKMKTTNPNCYIVRPNVAFIAQGESVDIKVFLAETAPAQAPGPSKDRFQLRVASAPGMADGVTAVDFWREHEADAPQLRIRFTVTFVPLGGDAPSSAGVSETVDAKGLLAAGAGGDAVGKVSSLAEKHQERNASLASLKTELQETKSEQERTLREAPGAPAQAKTLVSDPFGGLSILAAGLIFVVVLLMYKVFL